MTKPIYFFSLNFKPESGNICIFFSTVYMHFIRFLLYKFPGKFSLAF